MIRGVPLKAGVRIDVEAGSTPLSCLVTGESGLPPGTSVPVSVVERDLRPLRHVKTGVSTPRVVWISLASRARPRLSNPVWG
jgi:hypothetical protein